MSEEFEKARDKANFECWHGEMGKLAKRDFFDRGADWAYEWLSKQEPYQEFSYRHFKKKSEKQAAIIKELIGALEEIANNGVEFETNNGHYVVDSNPIEVAQKALKETKETK